MQRTYKSEASELCHSESIQILNQINLKDIQELKALKAPTKSL